MVCQRARGQSYSPAALAAFNSSAANSLSMVVWVDVAEGEDVADAVAI